MEKNKSLINVTFQSKFLAMRSFSQSDLLDELSHAGATVQAALGRGASAWRNAVHTILLPPLGDRITEQEAALRVFLGGLNFGILCFPYAFRMAGMVNGVLFVLAIALINNYTSKLIIRVHRKVVAEAGSAITTLPELTHAIYGNIVASAVGYLMFTCQFGFCVSHCVFIGISMSALLDEADSSSQWLHKIGHYEVYVGFLCLWGLGFCLLVQIADSDAMAPVKRLGAVAMTLAVAVTIVHGVVYPSVCDDDDLIRTFCRVHKARWETLPVFFGIAIFVLESVPVLLAVEGSMANPDELEAALDVGQVGLTLLYIVVGVLGYWIYGTNTQSVIALNVSGVPGAVVKLLQCFSMSVAYVGLFIPAYQFLEDLLDGELVVSLYQTIDPAVKPLRAAVPRPPVPTGLQPFKILVVMGTVALALAFPHFGHLTSIFGCLTFSLLTLALPPLLYIKAFQDSMSRGQVVRCLLVVVLAVSIAALGLLSNLLTIRVSHIEKPPPTPPDRPSYLHGLNLNASAPTVTGHWRDGGPGQRPTARSGNFKLSPLAVAHQAHSVTDRAVQGSSNSSLIQSRASSSQARSRALPLRVTVTPSSARSSAARNT